MSKNKTLRDYNNEDDYHDERVADLINDDADDYEELNDNIAAIFFDDDGNLVIDYGWENKNIAIELNSDEDRAVIMTVLNDVNFWTAFLGALSQAVEKARTNV
jgi:hypothetical protein